MEFSEFESHVLEIGFTLDSGHERQYTLKLRDCIVTITVDRFRFPTGTAHHLYIASNTSADHTSFVARELDLILERLDKKIHYMGQEKIAVV